MNEIIAVTTEEIPALALLIRQVYYSPNSVLLEICCLPIAKTSLSKHREDNCQDSVTNYSQRMTICFILSSHLSFWAVPRSML